MNEVQLKIEIDLLSPDFERLLDWIIEKKKSISIDNGFVYVSVDEDEAIMFKLRFGL